MATVAEQIQKVYIGLLGRAADQAGLDYWTDEIESGALTLEELRANIVEEQPEYANGIGDMSRAQAVNQLYQNLFNRSAEEEGLDYWVNGGGADVSFDQLVMALVDGASATDTLALDNKAEVAEFYTETAGTDYEEAAARNAVDDVDGSTDIAQAKAAIESGVADSFTLTQGVDTLEGTSGNDIFNALNVNSTTGEAATTLNAFDEIDGAGGEDTLNLYTDVDGEGEGVNTEFPASASVENVEIVNVFNSNAPVAEFADASNFEGVEQLWQIGEDAAGVTNLEANTTAGFRNTVTAQSNPLTVAAASGAASASIALDGVAEGSMLNVGGESLNTVNVSGAMADSNENGEVAALDLWVIAGVDEQTITLNAEVDTFLFDVTTNDESDDAVTSVDASGSAGDITYTMTGDVTDVTTGAGDDRVTVGVEGDVDVTTGAGDDRIVFNQNPSITDAVDGGEGTDTVALGQTSFNAERYDALNQMEGIEVLEFTGEGEVVVDASRLDYTELHFATVGATVENLGADQTVTTLEGVTDITLEDAAQTTNLVAGDEGTELELTAIASTGARDGGALVVSGEGDFAFNNETDRTFESIDLSGLEGSSTVAGSAELADAETFMLGEGADQLSVVSEKANMDVVEGFDSVEEDAEDAVVDTLVDAGNGDTAITGNVSNLDVSDATSLNQAFSAAAEASNDDADAYVAFQFDGDTYVFADGGSDAGAYDDTDFALQLVGLHDLSADNDAYAALA